MWPLTRKPKYAAHLDLLVALITHLGYTNWNIRSTKGLAKAVGRTETEVVLVLDGFTGIFRKSNYTSPKGLVYYQLHVRHALRWKDELTDVEEEDDKLPLEPATVNALLDFIVKSADQERRHFLGYFTTFVAAVVSLSGVFLAIYYRTKC